MPHCFDGKKLFYSHFLSNIAVTADNVKHIVFCIQPFHTVRSGKNPGPHQAASGLSENRPVPAAFSGERKTFCRHFPFPDLLYEIQKNPVFSLRHAPIACGRALLTTYPCPISDFAGSRKRSRRCG
jgi:hypothetical protein